MTKQNSGQVGTKQQRFNSTNPDPTKGKQLAQSLASKNGYESMNLAPE